MNCTVHPEQEASGYCRHCGKAMCSACARAIHGVPYCEDCLAAVMGHSASGTAFAPGFAPQAPAHSLPNPGLAFALGFCPGLGAVYNGEYTKAILHIVVFAAMVAGLSNGNFGAGGIVALSLLLSGFVFYMAIDALRTARAKRAGAPSADPLQVWGSGKPVGAFVLIGLGVFFLLVTFDVVSWDRMWDFWPVFLIAAGVVMLWNRLGRPS
jgi:Domain of unknown function (DUF5668)